MIHPGISRQAIVRTIKHGQGAGRLRNKKCYCGSEKKFKKCCMPKLQGFIEQKETIDGKEVTRYAVPTLNDILMVK